ncbi:hypothetical protein FQZ97_1141220 [compost metagenome]
MVLQLELVQHVDLERPEAAAEVDVLCGRDALVAKDQHVVVQVRAVDALEVGGVDRLSDVEPDDLRTDRRIERPHLEGLRRGLGSGGCTGKNGSHAANVEARPPFPNEVFVACL